jgi:hypothetical protein
MNYLRQIYGLLIKCSIVLCFLPINTILANEISDCLKAQEIIKAVLEDEPSKEKIESIREAIELCPESEKFQFLLGTSIETYERTRKNPKLEPASEAYAEAINLNSNYSSAYFQLAGIDYLYGRFPKAKEGYLKFTHLADTVNVELLKKAEEMIVKCLWLETLSEGSVKFAVLHQDYGRFDATMHLIADISMELGSAATQATNNLGFLGGGLGVAAISKLTTAGNTINYSAINKAKKKDDKEKLYELYKNNLPILINEKGINSEIVQIWLNNIYTNGHGSGKDFELLFPYANAVAFNASNPKPDHKPLPSSTVLSARINLGHYYFNSKNYPDALNFYSLAKEDHIKLYGNDKHRALNLDYGIIASKIRIDSITSIDELNKVYNLLDKLHNVKEDLQWKKNCEVNTAWLLNEIANKVCAETSIQHYIEFDNKTQSLRRKTTNLTELDAIILVSYSNYLIKWGEYLQANDILTIIDEQNTQLLKANSVLAGHLSNAYYILHKEDRSEAIINSDSTLRSYPSVQWKRIYVKTLKSIDEGQMDTAKYNCNDLFVFHKTHPTYSISSIAPEFALWILNESEPSYLDSLLSSLEKGLETNFDKSYIDLQSIVTVLAKFDNSNPNARYAYGKLESLLNKVKSDKTTDLMKTFRYNWLVKNKEYEKALRLVLSSEKNNSPKVQAEDREDVLILDAQKRAFLLYKLERYQESLKVLESSYDEIEAFKDFFPDKELFLKAKKVKIHEAAGNLIKANSIKEELESVDSIIWNLINY